MNWGTVTGAGKMIGSAAKAAWGNSYGKRAIIGAGIGGAYGGMSQNTSILGGMAMGAGLGAGSKLAGRYGVSALKGMRSDPTTKGLWNAGLYGSALGQGFGDAVKNMAGLARYDFGRAKLAANRGYSKIQGLFQ